MSDIPAVIRAFELPLQHCDKETWPLLRECWRHSTDLANWAVQQLRRADFVRLPSMKTWADVPKLPPVDLYALAFGRSKEGRGRKDKTKVLPVVLPQYHDGVFFEGAKSSAVCILNKVLKKYKEERYDAIWRHKQDFTEYKTFPWPVDADALLDAFLDKSKKPIVKVALPGGTVELRLRGGPEFGRQMGHFRELAQQVADWEKRVEALKLIPTKARPKKPKVTWKELSIREQSCSNGCHRPTIVKKTAGGGQDRHQRVVVKMVASLPVQKRTGDRVLTLTTDPNAFWVAELDGRQAWVLNADHVKRAYQWIAKHEDTLQRLAQDSKAERRLRSEDLLRLNEFREKRCEKHHKRMSSWLHETAAQLVGFAQRQHVGHILYRDVEQGFIERFPWAALKSKLKDKCDLAGVRLDCASDGEGGTNVA